MRNNDQILHVIKLDKILQGRPTVPALDPEFLWNECWREITFSYENGEKMNKKLAACDVRVHGAGVCDAGYDGGVFVW